LEEESVAAAAVVCITNPELHEEILIVGADEIIVANEEKKSCQVKNLSSHQKTSLTVFWRYFQSVEIMNSI
jgi:hypothetical protein